MYNIICQCKLYCNSYSQRVNSTVCMLMSEPEWHCERWLKCIKTGQAESPSGRREQISVYLHLGITHTHTANAHKVVFPNHMKKSQVETIAGRTEVNYPHKTSADLTQKLPTASIMLTHSYVQHTHTHTKPLHIFMASLSWTQGRRHSLLHWLPEVAANKQICSVRHKITEKSDLWLVLWLMIKWMIWSCLICSSH